MSADFDSALDSGLAEQALEAFVDQNFVMEEANEAIALIDMIDPEKPLFEELSPKGIEFLRGLRQETLMCMESLRPGARDSLERILNDVSRKV